MVNPRPDDRADGVFRLFWLIRFSYLVGLELARETKNEKQKTKTPDKLLNAPIFITGIGTGIGKTITAAIITEALEADYWKPVQAGTEPQTDSDWIRANLTNVNSIVHDECYRLKLAASPHLAARKENIEITVQKISDHLPVYNRNLIVEGAGGLLVPINDREFIKDLVIAMGAKLVLVSRNYLGSLNHSLLTAAECRRHDIPVAGWYFHGYDPDYENDIIGWTGIPRLASVPFSENAGKSFVKAMAELQRETLIDMLC